VLHYYINLSYRTDRKKHIINQFQSYKINNYFRIPAIKNKDGAIGCSKSHILAIETFLQTGKTICVILEDDFEFLVSSTDYCNFLQYIKTFQLNNTWDVILLSGNHINQTKYNECLNRCTSSQTTSGYIFNKKYASKLLDNYKTGLKNLIRTKNHQLFCLDRYWQRLQNEDNWFIANPIIGKQKPGYSDIEKNYASYEC